MPGLQDTLERAYTQDVAGQYTEAIRLYRLALQVLYEGLGLAVPHPGLGPSHSNVAKWRSEMNTWQKRANDRYSSPALLTYSRALPPPQSVLPSFFNPPTMLQ